MKLPEAYVSNQNKAQQVYAEQPSKRKNSLNFPLDLSMKRLRHKEVYCEDKRDKCDTSSPQSMSNRNPPPFGKLSTPDQSTASSKDVTNSCVTAGINLPGNIKEKPRHGKYKSYLVEYHKRNKAINKQTNANSSEPIRTHNVGPRDKPQPITKTLNFRRLHSDSYVSLLKAASRRKTDIRTVRSLPAATWNRDHGRNHTTKGFCVDHARKQRSNDLIERRQDNSAKSNGSVTANQAKQTLLSTTSSKAINQMQPTKSNNRIPPSKFNLKATQNKTVKEFLDQLQLSLSEQTVTHQPASTRNYESSNTMSRDNLVGLGDWKLMETGRYPAFGKLEKCDSKQQTSRVYGFENGQCAESSISEQTMQILRNASKARRRSRQNFTDLRCLATSDVKHHCAGCTNRVQSVPKMVSEIWKFNKTNKYTTPSNTSKANVVYCWQLQSKPMHKISSPSRIPSDSDVIVTRNQQKDHTSTSCLRLMTKSSQVAGERRSPVTSGDKTKTSYGKTSSDSLSDSDDDLLANIIENSSDEEDEERKSTFVIQQALKSRYHSSRSFPLKRKLGLLRNESRIFIENLIKNPANRSTYTGMPKVLKINSLATDYDKDFNVSDLEISDDDDSERSI